MRVHVAFNDPRQPSEPRSVAEKTAQFTGAVALVDVFRSSATIVEALDNGALSVVPCSSPEQAIEIKKKYGEHEVLLCGEQWGVTPKGFDLNISPRDMEQSVVNGKIIIYCSTNLTRILATCNFAETIIVAGFTNAKAAARYLRGEDVDNVVIVACGVHDMIALEDVVGAGAIVNELSNEDLTDAARLALLAYRNPEWKTHVLNDRVATYLKKIGFGEDLPYCIRENKSSIVPIYVDGRLVPIVK